MEHDCKQYVKSVVLNITFLGSMDKAQEMREGRKGRKEVRKERGTGRTERRTD